MDPATCVLKGLTEETARVDDQALGQYGAPGLCSIPLWSIEIVLEMRGLDIIPPWIVGGPPPRDHNCLRSQLFRVGHDRRIWQLSNHIVRIIT